MSIPRYPPGMEGSRGRRSWFSFYPLAPEERLDETAMRCYHPKSLCHEWIFHHAKLQSAHDQIQTPYYSLVQLGLLFSSMESAKFSPISLPHRTCLTPLRFVTRRPTSSPSSSNHHHHQALHLLPQPLT